MFATEANLARSRGDDRRVRADETGHVAGIVKKPMDPRSTLKSIQDHLSDRHMLGFLRRHEQNKGLSGGQYDEHGLDLYRPIVLETRTEIAEHTE